MFKLYDLKEKQPLTIKIKYFENATELEKIEKGNWIDLYASQEVFVEEGKRAMIPLGVAMELPKGYEAHVVPRNSTFKTWGLLQTNSFGVIDTAYCGDNDMWHMPVWCLDGKETQINGVKGTTVHIGDKICQFRIVEEMPELRFEKVEMLGNSDRGGFGSTGVK